MRRGVSRFLNVTGDYVTGRLAMSVRVRSVVIRVVVLSALVGLAVVLLSAPAFAALGDVLRTVNLPTTIACGGIQLRTSVAVVQGSKLGFPDRPIVLVTSCFVDPDDTSEIGNRLRKSLFVLDPGAPDGTISTATLLATITTTISPPNGWGSLAYRANKGDLLGCGSRDAPLAHQMYAIAFTGTATFLFDAAAGLDVCDGAAWDPSDNSVFMSPDVSLTIYHFKQVSGVWTLIGSFPSPTLVSRPNVQCGNSGLAVVGGTLFVGCDGDHDLFQLDKTTGAVIRSFVPVAEVRNENLACDPVTFASQNKDALWSTNGLQGSTTLFAFEIPAGTCGLTTGPTVLNPAACPAGYPANLDGTPKDTDGDGLLDCWEDGSIWSDGKPGIDFDGDGFRDLILCITNVDGVEECADKNVKDLFVEVDTMAQHAVNVTALKQVIAAFKNASVDSPNGIRLHVQVDDQNVPHNDNIALPPCTPAAVLTVSPTHPVPDADFDALKAAWFGTASERPAPGDSAATLAQKEKARFAKKMAFRYMLMAHNLTRTPGTTSASGCSEIGGNDAVVTLGSFPTGTTTTHKNGTTDQWAGTFMHEFGHMLNLRHGGGDNNNCKPNYLSVMSYTRQFSNIISDRPLDYSRLALDELNEAQLNESLGLGALALLLPAGTRTAFGPTPVGSTSTTATVAAATGGIDWNNSKTTQTSAAVDINKIASGTGCDGVGTTLTGYDDWGHLQYNLRASLDFSDGVHSTADEVVEITPEQAQTLSQVADVDADGIPDAMACGGVPCKIDIVPGLSKNPVLLFDNHGVPTAIVPVAILSAPGFDATTVNPSTLRFNATPVARVFGKPACTVLDVNGDRLRDLVCSFVLTGLSLGNEAGLLEGATFTGKGIRAQDTMNVVRFGDKD